MTLPKAKVITVGKIIQNEEALFEENRLMRKAMDNLENQLETAERQLEVYRGRYQETMGELIALKDDMLESSNILLEREKAKRRFGLYGYAEVGTPVTGYRHFQVGAKLVNRKTLFSLSVNPVNANIVYSIGIGYRIL